MRFINRVGQRFHFLSVISIAEKISYGKTRYLCVCDCGNKVIIFSENLTSGHTKSCGCYQKKFPSNKIHGMSNTRFYRVYKSMIERCAKHKDYSGRGIRVCKRWLDFNNFKDDMYPSYLSHQKSFGHNTSIDRINNNGHYSQKNCRWATAQQQGDNRRSNILINYNNQVMPLKSLSRLLNIPYMRLYKRFVIYKWPLNRAITESPQSIRGQ